MMAQSRAESTRDTCNYGQYINQFPQNTIKVIREFERIQKKICRHKMSIMFNEICINEEMLPKYTYIYIYIYIYIYFITPTISVQYLTASAYFHRCILCREYLIDSSVKGQCATIFMHINIILIYISISSLYLHIFIYIYLIFIYTNIIFIYIFSSIGIVSATVHPN